MVHPPDLKYSKEHEWARVEDEIATVGITDYAQQRLTDIVYVELPKLGKVVKQFDILCVVESVKSVSDVYSPVSGEVVEANKELEDHPEFINESPYEKGWIAKVKVSDPKELDSLMNNVEYERYVGVGGAH